jgi:mannonate dehydratase
MKESFRWYGPEDPVTLDDIKQAGATDIVSALHQIPNGEVWSIDEIKKRKDLIQNKGLNWTVVESLPIHEDIQKRSGLYLEYIENYKVSLENLATCGIHIICYNFMPVLDWTRTSLDKVMPDGSKALSYEVDALNAFDLFIAKREDARSNLTKDEINNAESYFNSLDIKGIELLTKSIIAGLPGSEEGYSISSFLKKISYYKNKNKKELRDNLISFLSSIIPIAEKLKSFLCIHPDDPPYNIFGIPRIVSTIDDLNTIFNAVQSRNNGLTFCTGSFGVREDNDLLFMFNKFSNRVHFIHFRSTQRDSKGNFYEADHLKGDVNMYSMVKAALEEENKRKKDGLDDHQIPMRPDHGHQMLDDLKKETNPGYSAIGRLKGLAELRGLAHGIKLG